MPKFSKDIAALTRENTNFRQEILTNEHSQVVLMSVEPGDDVGEETHDVDQVLVFVEGEGESVLDGERGRVGPGTLVSVPAGTLHNFVNTGAVPLKLYTVYAPPEEEPGVLHRTKAEAVAAEREAEGK